MDEMGGSANSNLDVVTLALNVSGKGLYSGKKDWKICFLTHGESICGIMDWEWDWPKIFLCDLPW